MRSYDFISLLIIPSEVVLCEELRLWHVVGTPASYFKLPAFSFDLQTLHAVKNQCFPPHGKPLILHQIAQVSWPRTTSDLQVQTLGKTFVSCHFSLKSRGGLWSLWVALNLQEEIRNQEKTIKKI